MRISKRAAEGKMQRKKMYKKVFNVRMKYQFCIPMERYDVAYYQQKACAHTSHTRTYTTRKTRSKEKERGAQVRQCAAIVI